MGELMKLNLNSLMSLLVLIGLIIFIAIPLNTVFASSNNWSQVARFTEKEGETAPFTCEHVEWRIRWLYEPSQFTNFNFYVYPQGGDAFIEKVEQGGTQTSGILYFHDQPGTFYIEINGNSAVSCELIVEQDLNSIPEFPSWVILSLVLIATFIVITYRKKLTNSDKLT